MSWSAARRTALAILVLSSSIHVYGRQDAARPAPSSGGAPARPAPPPAPPPSQAAIDKAAEILAAARQAMGGEKLAAVKTVVATGRTRRVRGNNIQPIEFEMSIELPDKYTRRDEFPAEASDPTSIGFNAADLVQFPVPAAPAPAAARPGGPPPPSPAQMQARLDTQRKARVTTIKQDFARFTLGMFANSVATYPLTFAFVSQAEAPQGKADVLDVRGEANFSLRFFINAETHVPIMVSWQETPTGVVMLAPGQPPPASVAPGAVIVTAPPAPAAAASQTEKDKYASDIVDLRRKAQATLVEQRLYFADYRDVEGVRLPFRLRRAIGADTTEETTFDRFRLNTKIDPKKFAAVK